MRLIDADVLLGVMQKTSEREHGVPLSMIKWFMEIIAKSPTVEAVPVVHCKDCEHWGTGIAGETEHVKCCEYGKYMVGENGYCCYADMRGGKNG